MPTVFVLEGKGYFLGFRTEEDSSALANSYKEINNHKDSLIKMLEDDGYKLVDSTKEDHSSETNPDIEEVYIYQKYFGLYKRKIEIFNQVVF